MTSDARLARAKTGIEAAGRPASSVPLPRRIGPPCGCQLGGDLHECGAGGPIPFTPRHVDASRAAWAYLQDLGLLDSEHLMESLLRPGPRGAQ